MNPESPDVIIAVDPGRSKCGLAIVRADGTVLLRAIVDVEAICDRVREHAGGAGTVVVVGNGTGSARILETLRKAGCQVEEVDETHTSELARQRYLADHPERGWRRLLPMGLRTPREPYDDYVALILAERRIQKRTP